MRRRMNCYFDAELHNQIVDAAASNRIAQTAVVEAAVASYFSPDGADRREAAFTRRLDRMSRQLMRLERNVGVTVETMALFVRFWLAVTPPLDPDAHASAQAKARQRYEGFIDTLARRVQAGESFLNEIPDDVDTNNPESAGE
jgi:hypothetical protein